MAETEAETLTAPLTIWLTDRSRWKTGLGRCMRQRYLGNHFGPSGYGITTTATSVPLATGSYVHLGVERMMEILRREDRLPALAEVRAIITEAQAAYEAECTLRGYRGVLQGAQTDETIVEQKVLISGLLWVVRLKVLPWIYEQYQVIEVEQERLHFLDCTCGAAPLDAAEHIRRGCEGHALMIRTDILAQRRVGGSLAYFEVKTTGWDSAAWVEQWETDPQLGLGTLDLAERYGAEVTELYIIGLQKGRRVKDRGEGGEEDPAARKRQQTSLCYGYRRPGNPPLATDDWLPAYKHTNADGVVKTASRAHRKTGVWELATSDWPTWEQYRNQDPAITPEEVWVRSLPDEILNKTAFILGPMNRQDHQLQAVRRGMLAEERRWEQILWQLHDELLSSGASWGGSAFQAVLDQLVPQSWQCRPFGAEHQCEFVPICHRESGWQDPLTMGGRYRLRRPHHTPEMQQAIARGLLVDDTAVPEEQE